jgi:hypothetical protein
MNARLLPLALLTVLTAAVTSGCGGGSSTTHSATAPKPTSQATTQATGAVATAKLEVDPCTLLTLPEVTTAIGDDVTQGGSDTDGPDSCTFSRGGDIGRGVVHITNSDPLTCAALARALDAGTAGTNAVRVDVGKGGFMASAGGNVQFAVNGGCLSIAASIHGRELDQDALIALATAAADRVS